jgi:two-component system cell cycle response regulator DivK
MIDASNWQVLVVEDEFDSAELIAKILQYHGAKVHLARNGLECLEKLKDLEPTIVLLDLSLPGMDGWETLIKIRANSKTAQIPVAAITAYHSVSVAEDAHQAGFDAYFSKPISTTTIMFDLANILEPGKRD